MPMSDGRNHLKKIEFQIGERRFKFAINPENYVHRNPHRTTAIKTKSRIVIEDLQSDVPVISIRGTTGFNPTGREQDRGINKIKEMKRYLEDYANSGGNGNTPTNEFYFNNYTNDEYYVVHIAPEGVNYTQDANEPLLFRYEITFTVLRKAGQPSEDDIVDPEIGNRFPSIPQGPGFSGSSPYPIGPGGPQSMEGESIYEYWKNRDYDSSGDDSVYTDDNLYKEPINPQAPSSISYTTGMTGLGYLIGYYGRTTV